MIQCSSAVLPMILSYMLIQFYLLEPDCPNVVTSYPDDHSWQSLALFCW